jgi:chromosome segregation ATPase
MNPSEKLVELQSFLNKREKDLFEVETKIEALTKDKQNILENIKSLKSDISFCATTVDQYERLLSDFTLKTKQLIENVRCL